MYKPGQGRPGDRGDREGPQGPQGLLGLPGPPVSLKTAGIHTPSKKDEEKRKLSITDFLNQLATYEPYKLLKTAMSFNVIIACYDIRLHKSTFVGSNHVYSVGRRY